ncbi:hypothetical protein pb186bvf_011265 [Paramecium bursaria]
MKSITEGTQMIIYLGLKKLDIYGQNISLNIKGENQYQTAFGGLSSLAIVSVIAVFFWSNIQAFVLKQNLISVSQDIFTNDPEMIELDKSNFMAAVSIAQKGSYFTESPYFNISVQQQTYTRYSNGTLVKNITYVDLVPCQLSNFQNLFTPFGVNFSDQFYSLGMQYWLCPRSDQKIQLRGTYSSATFQYIKIAVTNCSNDTSQNSFYTWKPQCAPQSAVDSYLAANGEFKFQIYSTNMIINAGLAEDYSQIYLDDELYFTFIPYVLNRQANIYYRKYQVQNDESLLPLEDIQQSNYYLRQSSDYRDLTQIGTPADKQFAAVFLRRSNFSQIIKRQYQKISDLLSYLGGFLQIMVVAVGFVIVNYNRAYMMIDLANMLFDFKKKKSIEETLNVKSSETETLIQPQLKPSTPQNLTSRNKLSQDKLIIKQTEATFGPTRKLVNEEAKSNFIENIKQQLQPRQFVENSIRILSLNSNPAIHKISNAYKKAKKRINNALDVQTLFNKFNELEKLKTCVFNHNQLTIFNFNPKQTIQYDHQNKSEYRIKSPNSVYPQNHEDFMQELYVALEELLANQNNQSNSVDSRIDKKLIQQLKTEQQIQNVSKREETTTIKVINQ